MSTPPVENSSVQQPVSPEVAAAVAVIAPVTPKKTRNRLKKRGRKVQRMNTTSRATLISLWEHGAATVKQLSERYNRTPRAIEMLLQKAGAKKNSKGPAFEAKVREEVAKKMLEHATVVAARITDTREEHYKLGTLLAKVTGKLMIETAQAKEERFGNRKSCFQALQAAGAALRLAREERFAALDVVPGKKDDEDALPELNIVELTADQIHERQRVDQQNDQNDLDSALDAVAAATPAAAPGESLIEGIDDDRIEESGEK